MKKFKPKIMIFIILFFLFLPLVRGDEIYIIKLLYNRGYVSLNENIKDNVKISEGFPSGKSFYAKNFRYGVISFSNKNLLMKNFEFPLIIMEDWHDKELGQWTGRTIILNETNYTLILPYSNNGKTINIYNNTNNKLLLSIDVSIFARCNENSICESFENNQTCPQDCSLIKQYWYVIFIFAFIILATIIWGFRLLKHKRSEFEELEEKWRR